MRRANALVDRIDKGETLEAVAKEHGLKVETSKPFKRNAADHGTHTKRCAAGFRAAQREGRVGRDTRWEVAQRDRRDRNHAGATGYQGADRPAYKRDGRLMQNDALSSYVGALQERYGVAINDSGSEADTRHRSAIGHGLATES